MMLKKTIKPTITVDGKPFLIVKRGSTNTGTVVLASLAAGEVYEVIPDTRNRAQRRKDASRRNHAKEE